MNGIDSSPKKPCKHCTLTGHFPWLCPANPKAQLKRKIGLRRTPIKKIGKQTKQWFVTRATWIRKNPPDKNGFWYCYLQIHPWCPKKLTIDTLTLDHVISRSRNPRLRFKQSNLKPACLACNEMKGSRDLDQVKPLRVQ